MMLLRRPGRPDLVRDELKVSSSVVPSLRDGRTEHAQKGVLGPPLREGVKSLGGEPLPPPIHGQAPPTPGGCGWADDGLARSGHAVSVAAGALFGHGSAVMGALA